MTKTNDNFFTEALNDFDVWLAPMAGVTDAAYRKVCRKTGVALMTTEMISAKGLFYKNDNTLMLLTLNDSETQTGVQLFGSDPNIISEVIKSRLNDTDFKFIDINMGCPVKKVVSNNEGSALMSDSLLAAKIVEAAKKVSLKPVSVKTRLGIDSENVNIVSFAKTIENAGADLITIHARTRQMMFSGKADFTKVAEVVQNANIPIIANGDVCDIDSYIRAKKTGADGVMVGRAAIGNPFIFSELKHYKLTGEKNFSITNAEKSALVFEHFANLLNLKGERVAVNEFRMHLSHYTKGMAGSNAIRGKLNKITSARQMQELIYKAYSECE